MVKYQDMYCSDTVTRGNNKVPKAEQLDHQLP